MQWPLVHHLDGHLDLFFLKLEPILKSLLIAIGLIIFVVGNFVFIVMVDEEEEQITKFKTN